jgi:hypothetical protein
MKQILILSMILGFSTAWAQDTNNDVFKVAEPAKKPETAPVTQTSQPPAANQAVVIPHPVEAKPQVAQATPTDRTMASAVTPIERKTVAVAPLAPEYFCNSATMENMAGVLTATCRAEMPVNMMALTGREGFYYCCIRK